MLSSQGHALLSKCRQMIQETLPIRKQQLYETYGPGGSPALVPATQATNAAISFGATGGTGIHAHDVTS